MNRRQFTQRLMAVGAAPLLPTGIGSGAVAATPVAVQNQHHMWGAFIARIHDKASPQMLKRHLSLTDDQAENVFHSLIKDNVISMPNADGISHAMNPFKRNFTTSLASSPQSAFQKTPKPSTENRAKKLFEDKAQENFEEIGDDSDVVNDVTPECQDEPDTIDNPPPTDPPICA